MPLLPRFRNTAAIMILLGSLWLTVFIYFEHIRPFRTARHCRWTNIGENKEQTNVLLVADPQLIDNHTYPGRSPVLLLLSKHTVDVYLKQNYKALVNHLQPDFIMFLGDYLDNGRLSLDKYYESEFRRFERIFNRWSTYQRGERWHTHIAGNHDIGFGNGVKIPLRDRFNAHFGLENVHYFINGVEFILLDTISYSSSETSINAKSREFVLLLLPKDHPRVLLSHVPFYRDTKTHPCGPLRERAPFFQNAGYQYQLALSPEILAELLDLIQPDMIFSGDDHDYCDVVHPGSVREVTVKSISMAMGINYPAVQLLSFSTSKPSLNYQTDICYLPRPYVNVFVYVCLAVVSWLVLLYSSIKLRRYVYTALPSEHVMAVFLEGGQAPMSKRMSKFLKVDESPRASLAPLSNYTKTSTNQWEKLHAQLRSWKAECILMLRRWNLLVFVRLCGVLGATTITIYLIVVACV